MKFKVIAGGVFLAFSLHVTQANADTVTFEGLQAIVGANATTGAIPSSYQPLMSGYSGDGAADSITINFAMDGDYATANVSNLSPLYGGSSGAVAFTNGGPLMVIDFSAPVNISSLSYANYSPGSGYTIAVTGFTDDYTSGDTNVAGASYTNTYAQATGSNWVTATLTGASDVESLTISGTGNFLIGGLTLSASVPSSVPEPNSIELFLSACLIAAGYQYRRVRG